MKKTAIFVLCAMAVLSADPVRNLKAFDSATGAEITTAWQNKAKQVKFTWKEPLAEIKTYKYAFGPTGTEALNQSTETNTCSIAVPKDGTYIFRIVAVDTSGKTSEEKTFAVNLDTTPPDTALSVSLNKNALTFMPGTIPSGSPLKGILFYYGPKQDGQPDRFCVATADIAPLIPRQGDPVYYINAALEDTAGNVSSVQTIATVNGTEPALAAGGSPNMRILNRTSDILNEKKELTPGARIHYVLTLTNDGSSAAPLVELIDSVPIGTTLIANSAKASRPTRIEFFDTALNAGKGAWTGEPTIDTVKKIRWTYLEPFPVGQAPDTIEYTVEADKI